MDHLPPARIVSLSGRTWAQLSAPLVEEEKRLLEDLHRDKAWKRWGPYLSERQWGTVREDYSPDGECWKYFTHEQARSRAYRWGEDGLMGITDRQCRLCFSLALWNGQDKILKERLYGLSGPEGNHGEDVKECYYYVDATPTNSYLKGLYKYPQKEFPYQQLLEVNGRRSKTEREFELVDTGIFDESRYFDVVTEYAKNSPNDILIKITITNHGPDTSDIHVLPTMWYRNTWAWGRDTEGYWKEPKIVKVNDNLVKGKHESLGTFYLAVDKTEAVKTPEFIFTNNDSNLEKLYNVPNTHESVKDAFHEAVVFGNLKALSKKPEGTKVASWQKFSLLPGQSTVIRLRLYDEAEAPKVIFGAAFEEIFTARITEANKFFKKKTPPLVLDAERERVLRQAYAGLIWSKQYYQYDVAAWLDGDSTAPPPPGGHASFRNTEWRHLYNRDVLSMPDKWEYPWFAAWDLAFHMVPFARIDADFAKEQLILLLREWYMSSNGQIPAYEFNFSDVNPPVHAWSAWQVYRLSAPRGQRDKLFLGRVFNKLLLNFTWWVNRKDLEGKNLFSGGFLGLDNIGVFDRSKPLPTGGSLEQADGTAWMAFYCVIMLEMALELAKDDPVYEDLASKFFEHFVAITDAINSFGGSGLWDEEDGFYYDQLQVNGKRIPLKVRSMVGIIPLFASCVLKLDAMQKLPGFYKRMQWFMDNRKDLSKNISYMCKADTGREDTYRLLAIPSRTRLKRVLKYLLDEDEFLSENGIRSLSKVHGKEPYSFFVGSDEHRVEYVPGDSDSGLFGGNSNWRGPVWFPVNFLLIEALRNYYYFYADDFKVECPTGSGNLMNLAQVAEEISRRLVNLFLPDKEGKRPCHGSDTRYADDPNWKDLLLFYEYFDGDTGRGIGASHQTGWTALVTRMVEILTTEPPLAGK